MIRIRELEFNYGRNEFRLKIPAFDVGEKEKVAVIGPSGSGKTTLLNLIAGISVPATGNVRINNMSIDELGNAARRNFRINNIGFVFQDFELLDYLNVMDNITHPYRITNTLKLNRQVKQRAAEIAKVLGLQDKLQRNVSNLSQGEKQRTAICRAVLTNPKIILADEATGNLDPKNKIRILDLLFESIDLHDATLVAVTHDHDLLDRFDRVVDFQEFQVDQQA